MKQYKHILFDLDGTLVDSKEGITKSVQYALAKFGIKENNLEKLEKFIGPPLTESYRKYYGFDKKQVDTAIDYHREYYTSKGIFCLELYKGIFDLLTELAERNKYIYIATSKPTIFAKKIIKLLKLNSFFSLIVGSNLDKTRYAKAEVIEYLLKQIKNLNKSKTIMVGDREHDAIGADKNKIDSILVTYGYGSTKELKNANPNFLVSSVNKLSKILLI